MPVQTEHRFPLDPSVPDAAGVARYQLTTALPTGSFDAQRCRPRSTGRNAPTILPQRATKG